MKLGLRYKFLYQNHQNPCRVFASLFSTKTPTPTQSPSSNSLYPDKSKRNSLYDRIQIIRDPKTAVVPVLEQWVSEGNNVDKRQLQNLVRTMKDYKRFHHALEISQWMTDRRYLPLSPADVALRLDLIHRVHGIKHAENYFNNISNNLKSYNVYGAILSGYMRENSVEKAEAIMQKMREMGFATSSFPYNMLINLYTQTGDNDKIENLIQEMNKKGIPQDKYTIRNRIAAYIAASDISGMERILNRVEEDPQFFVDWKMYSMAASGYLKVGMIEKALSMLKKIESMLPLQRNKLACEFLLTLYASTGLKDELYRVWDMYKPPDGEIDASYACMIASLAKLDDLEGAEKIFEEWESKCTMYDFRVLNRLLVAYCRKGLFEKAESALNKAAKGRTAYASSWNVLAVGYAEDYQMAKAVEMLKRSISIGRRGWQPHPVTLNACLDYLEAQGDVDGIEEMMTLLKNLGSMTRDIYHRWLRNCVAAGNPVSQVVDQMKMDGFSADEETNKILETLPSL